MRGGFAAVCAFAGLAAALSCTGPEPFGAEPARNTSAVEIADVERALVPGDPVRSARGYLDARAGALGVGEEQDDFEVTSVRRGSDGRRYVRMRQLRAGIPVWGAEVAVRVSSERVWGVSGELAAELGTQDAPRPAIPREAALSLAGATRDAARVGEPLETLREDAELVWFVNDEGAVLAWYVEAYSQGQVETVVTRPRQIIDATTGDELLAFDAIAKVTKASGLGGNPRVPRRWVTALEVTPGCGGYALSSPRLETVDMGGRSTGSGRAVEGSPRCMPGRAANDAHGFAAVTLDMLADWMERESIDGEGAAIRSRVRYGDGYPGAFWDGRQVTYGDGGEAYFPLAGDLSVVAHEILHGFTEHHADLVFQGQAGALNESFSDVAGAAASFYADGAHDTEPRMQIGADIARRGGAPLRDLCEPARDGRSIDHVRDYEDGMFVHAASGVANRAFCLAARGLSGKTSATRDGVRRAARVWVEANAGFWTRTSDFEAGCRGVLGAAAELGYAPGDIQALADAWAEVGVRCDGKT